MSQSINQVISRKTIQLLVDSFYKKAIRDELIGPFFTEVVALDFEDHMPVMYDFWDSTINCTAVYKGNPMTKHFELNKLKKIEPAHFKRWINLWQENAFEILETEKAKLVTNKAYQIGQLMEFKLSNHQTYGVQMGTNNIKENGEK